MQTIGDPNPIRRPSKPGRHRSALQPYLLKLGSATCATPLQSNSGWLSTIPRQTLLPAPSTTHPVRWLEPTSKPANIVIAAFINSEKARFSAGEQQPHVWDVLY